MRVLYIDIDSLRPDHLGCYGYARPTSPRIDALAAAGLRFTRCYVSDSPCLPSRTALFGGRLGTHTGVVNHGGRLADPAPEGRARGFRSRSTSESLAEQLRRAGLRTASISPFPHRHSAYQIWEGFHETIDTGGDGLERAHVVFPHVARWLAAHAGTPSWFLHVNLWDPHTPYDAPPSAGDGFTGWPAPAWLTDERIAAHRLSFGPHDAVTPHGQDGPFDWPRGAATIRDQSDWTRWIGGYDAGIRHADAGVGAICDELRRLGLWEDTLVILSADHGENQGELEVYGDHQTADEHTHHVPLIVAGPGIAPELAGRAWPGLLYQLDLGPTLVELAGNRPPAAWHGRSFAPLLRNRPYAARDWLVLSHGAWSCQRSVRWEDYLLIHTLHPGQKNFLEWMLFDLSDDPHETRDLTTRRPDLLAAGQQRLREWEREHLAGRPDPLREVIAEGGPYHARDADAPRLARRLRATGRPRAADWLERHPAAPRPRLP